MSDYAKCVYCLHGVSEHGDNGCLDGCWCQWTRRQLLEIDPPPEVRPILGHLDTGKRWRDQEGDIWRYVDAVGWTWSRSRPDDQVLDEPGIPTYADGPFTETTHAS